MPPLEHTPYIGGRAPFTIGLSKLDLADWIELDERLERDLALKDRVFAEAGAGAFREEPASREAQSEALELLVAHLPARFPDVYRRANAELVAGAGRRVVLSAAEPPLLVAARLVQDDLLLMQRDDEGWRLTAAALCFPSSWSLAEKFGQTLDGLHAAVPGYHERLALRMARIFDNLQADLPVWRLNWSLYPDDELRHASSKQRPRQWFADAAPDAFVRVERQSLRRLPKTGAILFTVKIQVDPLDAIRRHPDRADLAAGLRDQILALDADQLAYKGLTDHASAIAAHLDAMIAPAIDSRLRRS